MNSDAGLSSPSLFLTFYVWTPNRSIILSVSRIGFAFCTPKCSTNSFPCSENGVERSGTTTRLVRRRVSRERKHWGQQLLLGTAYRRETTQLKVHTRPHTILCTYAVALLSWTVGSTKRCVNGVVRNCAHHPLIWVFSCCLC